jgi:hypothetical protein
VSAVAFAEDSSTIISTLNDIINPIDFVAIFFVALGSSLAVESAIIDGSQRVQTITFVDDTSTFSVSDNFVGTTDGEIAACDGSDTGGQWTTIEDVGSECFEVASTGCDFTCGGFADRQTPPNRPTQSPTPAPNLSTNFPSAPSSPLDPSPSSPPPTHFITHAPTTPTPMPAGGSKGMSKGGSKKGGSKKGGSKKGGSKKGASKQGGTKGGKGKGKGRRSGKGRKGGRSGKGGLLKRGGKGSIKVSAPSDLDAPSAWPSSLGVPSAWPSSVGVSTGGEIDVIDRGVFGGMGRVRDIPVVTVTAKQQWRGPETEGAQSKFGDGRSDGPQSKFGVVAAELIEDVGTSEEINVIVIDRGAQSRLGGGRIQSKFGGVAAEIIEDVGTSEDIKVIDRGALGGIGVGKQQWRGPETEGAQSKFGDGRSDGPKSKIGGRAAALIEKNELEDALGTSGESSLATEDLDMTANSIVGGGATESTISRKPPHPVNVVGGATESTTSRKPPRPVKKARRPHRKD